MDEDHHVSLFGEDYMSQMSVCANYKKCSKIGESYSLTMLKIVYQLQDGSTWIGIARIMRSIKRSWSIGDTGWIPFSIKCRFQAFFDRLGRNWICNLLRLCRRNSWWIHVTVTISVGIAHMLKWGANARILYKIITWGNIVARLPFSFETYFSYYRWCVFKTSCCSSQCASQDGFRTNIIRLNMAHWSGTRNWTCCCLNVAICTWKTAYFKKSVQVV